MKNPPQNTFVEIISKFMAHVHMGRVLLLSSSNMNSVIREQHMFLFS